MQQPTHRLVASPYSVELDDFHLHLEQVAQAAIPQSALPFPTEQCM